MQFEGIWTPIVTPYREDITVDEGALGDVVEQLIAGGVAGIISAGTTGSITRRASRSANGWPARRMS